MIELKRGEVGEVVLNNLYKHTQLQQTFGIITLAIVAGRPRVLSLLEVIEHFIEFRREVVRRRIEFELRKAEARAHILEGLRIALDHIDAVIALIRAVEDHAGGARSAWSPPSACREIQAQAILDLQLQRLTGLERQKILDELAELIQLIERLRTILGSQRAAAADHRRRTEGGAGEVQRRTTHRDHRGRERVQHRGPDRRRGRGDHGHRHRLHQAHADLDLSAASGAAARAGSGCGPREEDVVNHLFVASTHSYMMIFTDRGRAYWLKVHEIPDVGADGRGKSIANLVQMEDGEKIASMVAVREFDDGHHVVMGTRQGTIKKTELSAYANPRAGGIIAIGIDEGDARDRRADLRRRQRGLHRHARRHGDPLSRGRRAADGPHRPTACAASACARATRWWPWKWSSPAARC